MKSTTYIKLQKKFGGMWIASSKSGVKVYAAAKKVEKLFDLLEAKNILPQKTVIGFIHKYGQTAIYFSLPIQTG